MGDQVCKSGSAILADETAGRLAHFVRESVVDIDAIDDADHCSFDRHILIANCRSGSLSEGTHHHLAGSRAESVSYDDDAARWLLIEIVRVDNQKPDALEIGRLLRRPDCAYDFS